MLAQLNNFGHIQQLMGRLKMSGRQVIQLCCRFPVVEIGGDTIQHRLGIRKQVYQGFEQWDAHNAEEAKLQATGQLVSGDQVMLCYNSCLQLPQPQLGSPETNSMHCIFEKRCRPET